MNFFILSLFATLPSFLWLIYYYKKDKNPEPKKTLLYVFVVGAFFALLGYYIQKQSVAGVLFLSHTFPNINSFLIIFQKIIVVALSEELLKYLAFFVAIRHHKDLDEPVDFIIYMITAALGFAAFENFLILSSLSNPLLEDVVAISALRFLSATFLHALASGILGIFLFYNYKKKNKNFFILGISLATIVHAAYNFLIMRLDYYPIKINVSTNIYYIDSFSSATIYPMFFIIFAFLLFLSIFLSFFIEKIKKINKKIK